MLVFGPIPSRRLGRSLGINNIPPKVCTYSCIYCQVGSTDTMTIDRKDFYSTDQIYDEVSEKITSIKKSGEKIDYLTFVPDGEPTLDVNLGKTIDRLKSFGIKIAVITNSSLIWDKEVQNDLRQADWVSVKLDSVYEDIWRKINRPHGSLNLQKIILDHPSSPCKRASFFSSISHMPAQRMKSSLSSICPWLNFLWNIVLDILYFSSKVFNSSRRLRMARRSSAI